MLKTDPETSLLTSPSPSVGTPSRFVRLTCSGILIISCTLFGYAQCYAQDVAEAARQEKARKENQQKKTKHVYTDEDLKKAQILTPEDREVVEARKKQQPLPGTAAPQESLDAQALANDLPLGDVARHYRALREMQRLQQSAEFHLPFVEAPVLAAPQPGKPVEPVAPEVSGPAAAKRPVVRVRPIIEIPAEPKIEPYRSPVKRSPFARPRIYLSGPARAAHSSGSQVAVPKAPALSETPSQASGISVTPSKPAAPAHDINPASSPRLAHRVAAAQPASPDLKISHPSTLAPIAPSKPAPPAPNLDAMPSPQVTPHVATAAPAAPIVRSSTVNPSQIVATPSEPAAPAPDLSVMPGPRLAPNVARPKPVAPVVRAIPAGPSSLRAEPAQPAAPSVPLVPSRPAKAAGVAPAAEPIAPAPSAKLNVVVVKPGDSLWKLAEENLGQGLRWHEFLTVNPAIVDANHIEAGSEIFLPSISSSYRTATRIIVRKGDTLSRIASERLGRGSFASCIAEANPAVQDVNKIYEGQELVLPDNCKP